MPLAATRRSALSVAVATSWLWLALGTLIGSEARAMPIGEQLVAVSSADELHALFDSGQIDVETFDALNALFGRGPVDLNTATGEELYRLPYLTVEDVEAILRYRRRVGSIGRIEELVTAGIVSRELLEAFAPFVVVVDATRRRQPESSRQRRRGRGTSFVRYPVIWAGDRTVPPMALLGQVSAAEGVVVGFGGTMTRHRPGSVVWDPDRRALVVPRPGLSWALPKLFVRVDYRRLVLLLGTYRIGFGQRLVFDTTTELEPGGPTGDGELSFPTGVVRVCEGMGGQPDRQCSTGSPAATAGDFRWTDGLRGMAASIRRIDFGRGWIEAHSFVSLRSKPVHESEVFDRMACPESAQAVGTRCPGPSIATESTVSSPVVSGATADLLPDVYEELVAGGNARIHLGRARLGLTAFGARVEWLAGAMLDFRESARLPAGGPFGAAGFEAAWLGGATRVDFEAAYCLAGLSRATAEAGRRHGGGAAIVRGQIAKGRSHSEAILRFYGKSYDNPFARPVAEPDRTGGLTARDEAGGSIRYRLRHDNALGLGFFADVWTNPSTRRRSVRAEGHAAWNVLRRLKLEAAFGGRVSSILPVDESSELAEAQRQAKAYGQVRREGWSRCYSDNVELRGGARWSFAAGRGRLGAVLERGWQRDGCTSERRSSRSRIILAGGTKPLASLYVEAGLWSSPGSDAGGGAPGLRGMIDLAYRPGQHRVHFRWQGKWLFAPGGPAGLGSSREEEHLFRLELEGRF
ncbi:MAG: helix-hairpin-helix domain-containing protein [Pseudomonadota bacterium]